MTDPSELVTVAVDRTACIGGGQCEMLEPDVFVLDEDEMIAGTIGDAVLPRERADVVVDRCPGRAVLIEDRQIEDATTEGTP